MDDLISRQVAIDAIMGKTNDSIVEAQAIDILCDLPSAQQWIPVSERLPELGKPVLATSVGKHQNFVSVDWIDSWTEKWNASVKVTAWMPLPEPWKGGEADV